jgi:membrane-associated protein
MGTIAYGGTWSTVAFVYIVLMIAAVAGNLAGYWVGRLIGPPLFKERTGLWGKIFNPKYIEKSHAFFEKYGARALILARFVPLVRTFVTLIAGVSKMSLKTFISYTAIGGIAWVLIVTTAGYFLGGIALIKNNFELACIIIVIVSMLPMFWEWFKARRQAKTGLASTESTD